MIPRCKIFYTNGDTVECGGDDDEVVTLTFSKKWLEAPSDGITHIISDNGDTGRLTLADNEYYYQMPLNFHGKGDIGQSNKIGPYLRQLTDVGGIVKFGGWTHNLTFKENAKLARADTWVKPPSGTRRENPEDEAD